MNYDQLPSQKVITKTIEALKQRNIQVELVENKAEALNKLKSLIPDGAEVMTGSSLTLQQIGFVDLLKSGQHSWKNLKEAIVAEKDPVKQEELRKKSISADYFMASVHALTEEGQVLIASASGSQLPSDVYSSSNVIWVVGAQKIVLNLDEAFKRLNEYIFPLENERQKSLGAQGSTIGKILIFEREIMPNRKVRLILVNEKLGF
jgi:L-lactate utilization protein LutC